MSSAKTGREPTLLQTPRLRLREAVAADAAFFCELLNDPDWIENIGDREIRSEEDARQYIQERICRQYDLYGYGLYVVERTPDMTPMGICGLVRRDSLPGPDLGFALLPAYRQKGYAAEASRAVMSEALTRGIEQLHAIVKPSNTLSIRLLTRLGFVPIDEPAGATGSESQLFLATLGQTEPIRPGKPPAS